LNVSFTGRLPSDRAAELMADAGAFVLPSREESFGIAYAEALCMGLPIVGYPPAVKEFGRKLGMDAGLPFDASTGGAADLAKTIRKVMSRSSGFNPEHRKRLLEKARAAFSFEQFGKSYVNYFEEVIGTVSESSREG
jgi:glycosyltransferase involved in cell wall biosynthesis